jgi:HSP20 family protein
MTSKAKRTEQQAPEATFVPDVDIRESGHAIELTANIPGVDQKAVDVTVENNVLTIEATATIEPPEGYELVGQEYRAGKYRRDFTLANSVDVDAITARVRHGVLELVIPKREAATSRKVKIGG